MRITFGQPITHLELLRRADRAENIQYGGRISHLNQFFLQHQCPSLEQNLCLVTSSSHAQGFKGRGLFGTFQDS